MRIEFQNGNVINIIDSTSPPVRGKRAELNLLTDKQSEEIEAVIREDIKSAMPYFLAYLQGDLDALRRWREDEPL